jgi:Ala-tRNA(Pro) deacylase
MSDQPRHTTELTSTHAAAVAEFLHGHSIAFDVVEHAPTESATAEARSTGQPPERFAKTIVLQDGAAYVLAVIPASRRLDLHKVRDVLGATRSLQLATETQMAAEFPAIEVGAVPPAGPVLPMAELVDRELLRHPTIMCAAGDHRHSLILDPQDLVRLTGAAVADICEEA